MTSPVPWDPATVTLQGARSLEEEKSIRYVQAVKTDRTAFDSSGNLMMRDAPEIGETDRVLSSVSSVYTAESFVPKVIAVGKARTIARMESKMRHSLADPETLARKWRIGYKTAKKTLAAMTQMAVRTASAPLYRRY